MTMALAALQGRGVVPKVDNRRFIPQAFMPRFGMGRMGEIDIVNPYPVSPPLPGYDDFPVDDIDFGDLVTLPDPGPEPPFSLPPPKDRFGEIQGFPDLGPIGADPITAIRLKNLGPGEKFVETKKGKISVSKKDDGSGWRVTWPDGATDTFESLAEAREVLNRPDQLGSDPLKSEGGNVIRANVRKKAKVTPLSAIESQPLKSEMGDIIKQEIPIIRRIQEEKGYDENQLAEFIARKGGDLRALVQKINTEKLNKPIEEIIPELFKSISPQYQEKLRQQIIKDPNNLNTEINALELQSILEQFPELYNYNPEKRFFEQNQEYGKSADPDLLCQRSEGCDIAVNKLKNMLGDKYTSALPWKVVQEARKQHLQTPCPQCYVFSGRAKAGGGDAEKVC